LIGILLCALSKFRNTLDRHNIFEDGSAAYRNRLDLMDSEDVLRNINLAFLHKEKELPKRHIW